MSNRSHDEGATCFARGRGLDRGVGRALAFGLLAGTAGCASSPQYPTHMGERAGDGTIMATQPRYAVSDQDAAQNEADRRAQAGYPAYGAAPMAEPAAPPASAPSADAAPAAAPCGDMDDDAPKPPAASGGTVDSADLPPPGAAPTPYGAPPSYGGPPPSGPDAAAVPPADPGASPHEIAYAYGGGQVVFGMDWAVAPPLELAAYRHRHHAAPAEPAASATAASAADSSDDKPTASRSHRRHHGKVADESPDTTPAEASHAAATDTPYQTVIKPGETLGEVAERTHSSRAALTALNDLKHPKHVRPGTVLKIPYRYSYDVQKGDTLYTIAHRFSQEPAAIAKLNGLKAIPTLQPGQTLQLPLDASDQGKRDHASASGPEPEAAPEKVANAALHKIERKSRHSRTVELNAAEASLPPQEIRHGRRRGAAATEALAEPPTETSAPPETAPAPVAPRPAQARSAEATTPARETPRDPAEPSTTERTVTAAGAGATRPYAPAPVAVTPRLYPPTQTSSPPTATYAGRAPTPASRASGPAPSTYVAPGYAARRPAAAEGQYASVTPPRYPAAGATAASPYPSSPVTPSPLTPSLGRERPSAPALSNGAASTSEIAAAARGRFIWPLRGPVVSGFGAKGTGEYNNGVDISAQPGAGVRAAAAGEVVYAGSSIPGYGNMVLLKHPGGWVTAYAHLNRIEVRMHDTVSQGDEIGQAGQTGVVDRPELYFEVRYAASAADRPRPVDPALVLPAGGG